jgi:hypothetical protein
MGAVMNRKDARSLTLGKGRRGRFEVVKLVLRNDDGTVDELEVEVRAPTYGQRQRILGSSSKDASETQVALQAALEATLACTFVDGQQLFEEGDRKMLVDSASGVLVINQVAPIVMKLIAETPEERVVEKN